MTESSCRHRSRRIRPFVVTGSIVIATILTTAVGQPATTPQEELAQLADALKAAVASGAMDGDEATKVYFTVAERLGVGDGKDDAKIDDGDADGTSRDVTLAAPSPREIRLLFRPDFLPRDVARLQRRLQLDEDQVTIVIALLRDYAEAFELATSPLRDGLARSQRSATDQWLISVFERVELPAPEVAAASIRETANAWAGDAKEASPGSPPTDAAEAGRRARSEELARRLLEAAGSMEERLDRLRDRVASDLDAMSETELTAEDLLRIAGQLREDRTVLRAELIELLGLITTDEQRGEDDAAFLGALDRLGIERFRPLGRFSGESIDLWAALAEAQGGPMGAADDLDAWAPTIAASLAERTEATLDREIAGLRFGVERDRITRAAPDGLDERAEARIAAVARSFTTAVQREIAASIATRDTVIGVLNGWDPNVGDVPSADESSLARRFREAALRRGFPAEMQTRWSERALDVASALPDLGNPGVQDVMGLRSSVSAELRELRAAAVARRIEREPALARGQADPNERPDDAKLRYGVELWLGMNHEAFAALDDRVASQLRAMLTPAQFAALPSRRSASGGKSSDDAKSSGKPGAATARKGGGKEG